MGAVLKQFEGSLVSPKDDAIMHEIFNEQNGVIKGCDITYLGANQLRIGAGYAYLCGRLVEVEEETVLSPFSQSTAEGEVILKIDLLSDTPAKLEARTPVSELVQEDINEGGSVYEYKLASYTVSDVAITNITVRYEVIGAGFSKDKILKTLGEVSVVTESGFLADALVVKEVNTNLGSLSSLKTSAKNNLVAAVNEVFQNASSGKSAIAAALTGKGVAASASETFASLASKITNNLYVPPKRLTGRASISIPGTSMWQEKSVLVNFATPFTTTPTLTLSWSDNNGYTQGYRNLTKTGFVLYYSPKANQGGFTVTVDWSAYV